MSEHTAEQMIELGLSKKTEGIFEQHSEKIIRSHVYMSLGIGLAPMPFIDFVAVTGVQLTLLQKLAKIYNTPFSRDMMRNIIWVLVGGAFPASFSSLIRVSFAKTIPGVGHLLGVVAGASISGASTYAIGKVFCRHFAEGGTCLSFDPNDVREFYEEMLREGKKVVADIKKKKTTKQMHRR
jgi:uncharacterized protein (DUF697 family)